ncbi:hypothetical protein [Citrobacter amalonaticus]|uniref:hypothetical protein n=1 Tax=Citrobacter amalonaticus TaxID=35703 RepID=UPI000621710B|nr:hypothetical protein [Citrobacter amalonaticus]KKF70216.1 hypothetical protein XU19_06070 [Vibrio parahaemolyticus]KKY41813.1 hypothetical protein AAY51_12670 [Vibrio parahaemolyticus]KOP93426.1 hypothetical protein ALC61_21200 [Citrobacter amalonaticus]KOP93920.1 hypothetical protein AL012_17940 [Citrobacter amalonaticus]
MTTITKEWLQQTIDEYEANRDELPFVLDTNSAIELQAFKLALASLTAEPVLYAAEETLAYAKMGELHLTCLSEPMGDAVIPLYTAPPVPRVPDGLALVPKRLTAENGAKGVLSGEFSETKFINCPECFGDDECETCDGSGRIEITVPVSWTTIKAIWAKGVEHFSAAPQQESE